MVIGNGIIYLYMYTLQSASESVSQPASTMLSGNERMTQPKRPLQSESEKSFQSTMQSGSERMTQPKHPLQSEREMPPLILQSENEMTSQAKPQQSEDERILQSHALQNPSSRPRAENDMHGTVR